MDAKTLEGKKSLGTIYQIVLLFSTLKQEIEGNIVRRRSVGKNCGRRASWKKEAKTGEEVPPCGGR